MSAPGATHERRVADLRTLGYLSGHRSQVSLARFEQPDVALADWSRRRLFVADAKDTEISSRGDTRRRLRSYRSAADSWRRLGFRVRLAVCATWGDDGWADLLGDFEPGGAVVHDLRLGDNDHLLWLELAAWLDDDGHPR